MPTTETMTIDLTPEGCKTPEGAARVRKATQEFEDANAAVANKATEFLDTHEDDILHCMEMYEGIADDVRELRALIVARRKKQDAFLRAVAGNPLTAAEKAEQEAAQQQPTPQCPSCESKAAPIPMNPEQVNAQHGDPRDASWQRRNPLMCPDCFGAGGSEDWGL